METLGEKNNLVDTALQQKVAHGARDTRAVRVAHQPNVASQPDATHQPNVTHQPNATHQPDVASQSDAALQLNATYQPNIAPQSNATHQPDAAHQPNATSQPDVALILEGGSFRGIFTAGVLDVLLEHGIVDFTGVWGTSAGAINAVIFKSRQIGRAMRSKTALSCAFMSWWDSLAPCAQMLLWLLSALLQTILRSPAMSTTSTTSRSSKTLTTS